MNNHPSAIFPNRSCAMLRVLAAILVLGTCAVGAETKNAEPLAAAIEPEAAGPDYAVQGEFLATLAPPTAAPADATAGAAGAKPYGVQVVARGAGKFQAVLLPGGLPGAGWDGTPVLILEGPAGAMVGAKASAGWQVQVEGDAMRGHDAASAVFTGKRTVRTSPTLGAKPPEGAVVLFDGTGTTAWAQGLMDSRGLLAALIPGSPGVAAGPRTKETFGDATFHIEFREPFMPTARGQSRGNSGVYLQERYEMQVLDAFGQMHGSKSTLGDVTGEVYKVAAVQVNACLPPLVWQTYDIDFTAARWDAAGKKTAPALVTARLNGILIHERVAIPKNTGSGKPETPAPGPLMLQHHATPVFYRNIWAVRR